MIRDERPPSYRGESVRTGDEPNETELRDRQAAAAFVRRRDWDVGLTVELKYDQKKGRFVRVRQ